MKRVCIIINRLAVGGAEQMVVGEVCELLSRGYAVTLVTFAVEREHSLMPLIPEACARALIPCRSLYDLRALLALAMLFRREQPDLIITQLWLANTIGRLAARLAGTTQVLLAVEPNVYDRVKSERQYWVDRLLQGSCARIIAISASVRDSLIRHGIRAKRITIVHNAIDLTRFADASSVNIRDELSIGDEFLYLSVGRIVPQKGVDVLLVAFAKQERGVLVIAGDGEERSLREAQATALGIADRVYFLGIRHDIPALMKAADCFVLASRWEGFGIVFAEALAAGLPIVATNVDGIREVVDDASGILVEPENSDALANALRRMREEGAMRARCKAHAPERARHFSIATHVDRLFAVLNTD